MANAWSSDNNIVVKAMLLPAPKFVSTEDALRKWDLRLIHFLTVVSGVVCRLNERRRALQDPVIDNLH